MYVFTSLRVKLKVALETDNCSEHAWNQSETLKEGEKKYKSVTSHLKNYIYINIKETHQA